MRLCTRKTIGIFGKFGFKWQTTNIHRTSWTAVGWENGTKVVGSDVIHPCLVLQSPRLENQSNQSIGFQLPFARFRPTPATSSARLAFRQKYHVTDAGTPMQLILSMRSLVRWTNGNPQNWKTSWVQNLVKKQKLFKIMKCEFRLKNIFVNRIFLCF